MQDLLSKEPVLERFFNYVTYDTQSKPGAKTSPSSAGQLALAKHLQQELVALGLQDIDYEIGRASCRERV